MDLVREQGACTLLRGIARAAGCTTHSFLAALCFFDPRICFYRCRNLYYAMATGVFLFMHRIYFSRCRTLYYAPLIGVFFGLYEHFRRVLS